MLKAGGRESRTAPLLGKSYLSKVLRAKNKMPRKSAASLSLIPFAMRLRLSPQARAANNPSRQQPQVSHYERMALGHGDSEA
jgi:hypothetical protein